MPGIPATSLLDGAGRTGAVYVTVLVGLAAGGAGAKVIVVGQAVMMARFLLMYGAQIPAK